MAKTFKKVVVAEPAPAPVKKTKPAVPPAPVAKAAKSAKTDEPKVEPPSKHRGRTSGMSIMAYQDHTLTLQAKRRLTDEELGADWHAEFPEARCQFHERMDIVRRVRQLFNQGRHGKQELRTPEPVPRYELVNNRRVAVDEPLTRRGKAKTEAA